MTENEGSPPRYLAMVCSGNARLPLCSLEQRPARLSHMDRGGTHLLQECDDIGVVLGYSELHGHLKEGPHHRDMGVIGRGQRHPKVLADLLDTL